MKSRLFVLIALLSASMLALASPVTSRQAEAEAADFLKSQLPTRAATLQFKTVQSCTSKEGPCYYIVSDDEAQCFAIVSGDDRLPAILGYSDQGSFDPDNVPENVSWWLNNYRTQISSFLKANPAGELTSAGPSTRSIYVPVFKDPIDAMIKTKWNQNDPYNKRCPTVRGERCVTGCLATAMAQLMKYYEWPVYPTGTNDDFSFEGTSLDWEYMLDEYHSGMYTSRQANAVALLMYECGRAVNMQYSPYSSGAAGNMVSLALPTYFDYSWDIRMENRDYYDAVTWDNMVYNELKKGRPVLYAGQSMQGGHAFICDGYTEGLYHFNWGWGGYQDGYFRLNALNPDAGGIGSSYVGGYNLNQVIFTNVYKNNGSTDKQLALISTDGFIYDAKEDCFKIKASDGMDYGLIYNPMPYAFDLTVGVKIVDTAGKLISYLTAGEQENIPSNYGYDAYMPDIPSLPDGKYLVYPAFKDDKGKWHDVQILYGTQQYVEMNVADGKETYVNGGIPADMFANLVISDPVISPDASRNVPLTAEVYVTNPGPGDYNGILYADIYAKGSNRPIDRDYDYFSLPKGATERLIVSLDAPDADIAELKFFTQNEDQIGETQQIALSKKITNRKNSDTLEASVVTPYESDVLDSPVFVIGLKNLTDSDQPVQFVIELTNLDGTVAQTLTSGELTIRANYNSYMHFGSISLKPGPGYYYWTVKDGNGKVLSKPYPMHIYESTFSDFNTFYTIETSTDAKFDRPMLGSYSETVVVPSNVDNEKYEISGLTGNVFVNSPYLKDLTIPAEVTRLGSAMLYMTPRLEDLRMLAETPCSISPMVMEEAEFPTVRLHVPDGSENVYMHTPVWSGFCMPSWAMDIPAEVQISGLEIDPATGKIYEPYYVKAGQALTFNVELPEGKLVRIWNTNAENKQEWHTQGAGPVTLQALDYHNDGKMNMVIVDAAELEALESEHEFADVYTTTGICIKRSATKAEIDALPAGIYLIGGRKVHVF